jgi:hypothetical protein
MTPKQYLEIKASEESIIAAARERISAAFAIACECRVPENLRPAVPDDVIEGAIIWKPGWSGPRKWSVVESVDTPADPFHGWTDDGCRYGIHGAFVEQNAEAIRGATVTAAGATNHTPTNDT